MWSIDLPAGRAIHAGSRGVGANAAFVQIAAALSADIRRGVLRAGDRLPSTRTLAEQLGVSRNTVVAAYDELVAQGWAAPRGAAGTFIADEMPDRSPLVPGPARATRNVPRARIVRSPGTGLANAPGYLLDDVADGPLTPVAVDGARILLSAGVPDPRLFPRVAMARAYRRAVRARSSNAALDYSDARGSLRLRTALAAMLRARRAIPVGPEHLMITRGSQMALDLAARMLVRPGRGDVVAVEHIGYQPAWRAFERAGATLFGADLDRNGLVVESLPSGTGSRSAPAAAIRAVYTTPHHQYPTTALMSSARRLALLERARRERFAILEDDYDHEFHFDGRPVAPLASNDPAGSVIYIGSLSKILAPGLRIGFVAAPVPVLDALAAIRGPIDRQGDHVLENAVADLVEEGEIQRHANTLRRTYADRREAFVTLLRKELGSALTIDLPPGGITLWARVADDIALDAWRARALEDGVAVAIARDFALDRKPRPFMRLAFARYTQSELAEAIRVLARALRRKR